MDSMLAPRSPMPYDDYMGNPLAGGSLTFGFQIPRNELTFGDFGSDDDAQFTGDPSAFAPDAAYAKLMPSSAESPLHGFRAHGDQDWFAGEKRKGSLDISIALMGSEAPASKHPRYEALGSDDDDIVVTSGNMTSMSTYGASLTTTSFAFAPSSFSATTGLDVGAQQIATEQAQQLSTGRVTRSVTGSTPLASRALSTITEESERSSPSDTPGEVDADAEVLPGLEEEEEEEEEGEEGELYAGEVEAEPGSFTSPDDDEALQIVLPLSLARTLGRKGRIPLSVAYPQGVLVTGGTYSVGVYGVTNGHRGVRLGAFGDLRARRIFYKKVKYGQRHILANGRQRIKGRFVKDENVLPSALASAPIVVATKSKPTKAGH